MKKQLLLAAALLATATVQAQNKPAGYSVNLTDRIAAEQNVANKSAANGDTIFRSNIILSGTGADTLTFYGADLALPRDSGYVTGYNAWGHKAYGELYRINTNGTPDSAISVLGMYTYIVGRASATSTKNVILTAWESGARTNPVPSRPNIFFTGMPTTVLAQQSVSLKALSVNATTGGPINRDTIIYFSTPGTYTSKSFYAGVQLPGYNWSNLAGDTAILISTKDGNRRSTTVGYTSPATGGGTDTTYLMQNVYQETAGTWKDFYWDHPYEMFFHLFAMPIIKIRIPSAVNGITKNDLTVFGTFPNPAAGSTRFKFSVAKTTSGRVELMDMTGRKLRVLHEGALTAGEHNIAVETADLAAGNYLISVRTAAQEGMAVQMTVAK